MYKRSITQIIVIVISILLVGCSSNEKDIRNNGLKTPGQISVETPVNKGDSLSEENDIKIILNNKEFSITRPLSTEDIKQLNADDLAILRNSYYAKHGYEFSNKNYSEYFAKFSWYKPVGKDVESKLSKTDTDAIKIIVDVEKKLKELNSSILYPVMKDFDKWGYIDSEGNLVIDYIYDYAGFFKEGVTTVRIDGKEGLIRPDGKYAIQPQYDFCGNYSEGWAHIVTEVEGESKHGFANINGKVFYKDYFNNNTGSFHEGLAAFEQNGKFGYIDTDGRIVIKPQYMFAYDFSEGLAMVVNDNQECGFIDKIGKVVIPFKYEHDPIDTYTYEGFSNGLAVACENNKYGFINSKGDYVVDPKYDYANRFSEGLASVCLDGKWGYINEKGEVVIKHQFEHVTSFYNGYAYAKPSGEKNGNFGFIDKTGKFVTPVNLHYENGGGYTFNTEWISDFHNELARVVIAGHNDLKFAYINKRGEVVWEMD